MCLSKIWTDSEMAEWLEGQGEVIEVWKYVVDYAYCGEGFSPPCQTMRFENYNDGYNKAEQTLIHNPKYWSGFHFLLNNKEALTYKENCPDGEIIRCLVKKEWITSMGIVKQLFGKKQILTIVASQAIFPHYPSTEAKYEDIKPFPEKKQVIAQPQMAGS